MKMQVFINNTFTGHYPVGTSAVVVAYNSAEAAELLEIELEDRGLRQTISPESMIQLDPSHEQVFILQDGDY